MKSARTFIPVLEMPGDPGEDELDGIFIGRLQFRRQLRSLFPAHNRHLFPVPGDEQASIFGELIIERSISQMLM